MATARPRPILNRVNAPSAAREHIREFDLLRGIAIIGVVYLHAYFTPWPEVSKDSLTVLHFVHLFAHGAVPLFLFISAYLQGAGPRETPYQHLRHRFRSVWLPVILWMAAALAYRLGTGTNPASALRELVLFDISGQFYFIWLLLVFGLLLTQVHRLSDRAVWALAGASFVANLLMIGFYEWHGGMSGLYATLAYRNPLAWVFFPVFGFALGRAGISRLPGRLVAAAAAGMAVVAAVYLFRGIAFDSYPASYFGVSIFLFSSAGMIVYPFAATWLLGLPAVTRPLFGLARYSFPIYLVHIPFAMGFGTKELLGDGADWSNYWLLLHANAAVGLFGSLAFVRELDKLNPRLGRTLLGIRRGASRGYGRGELNLGSADSSRK